MKPFKYDFKYTKVLTTCRQIAVDICLYATSFSIMGRQVEQDVSGKLSDLNNA